MLKLKLSEGVTGTDIFESDKQYRVISTLHSEAAGVEKGKQVVS